MKPPKELIIECPVCEEETEHDILGGRVEGKKHIVLKSSVKCCNCGHIHAVELVEEKPIDVPIIVSWMEKSTRAKISLERLEEVKIDEELYLEGDRIIVTSIEVAGVRKKKAKAEDITTIWAKKFDKVWIKVSLDAHGKVYSKKFLAVPEEEFEIGELVDIEGNMTAITAIKIEGRTLRQGAALARDIVRVYSKAVRK